MESKSKKEAIHNWSEDARPREKLLKHGAESLSVAELMAILIGSGSVTQDAVSLMSDVLASCNNNLTTLARITYDELTAFNGIGEAKAVTIMAALELARRRMEADIEHKEAFTCPDDFYHFFRPRMCDKDHEVFWVALLDTKLRLIDDKCISRGDVKGTVAEPRTIFNYVLTKKATAFAVAHNHPSGSPKPSEDDKRLTKRIASVAKELGVRFIDHIIVCDGQDNYFSFTNEGLL